MPLLGYSGTKPETTAGSRMDRATVFTKTAKGITQVNQKGASLSKDLMKVLKLIDGKANFGQIMEKAELDKGQLEKALNSLTQGGFARVFQTQKAEADPFGEPEIRRRGQVPVEIRGGLRVIADPVPPAGGSHQ